MTDEERISKCLNELSEFFDVVQIFVQRHDPDADRTESWDEGCGNRFARAGQISEWLDNEMVEGCEADFEDDEEEE